MRRLSLSILICLSSTGFGHGENRVLVESREFWQGETQCEVGIYLSNERRIDAIIIPLELRELTPGAFPASGLVWVESPQGRIYDSYLGPGVGLASRSRRYYPARGGTLCSGPASGTYTTVAAAVDYLSPDGVFYSTLINCQAPIGDPCWLEPGVEFPGLTAPSYYLRFNAGMVTGQFEIDTCCMRPANHLSFLDEATSALVLPEFSKGTVTIVPCTCECSADPVCDGSTDARDVAAVIDVAFRAGGEVTDTACPFARTDVNADGDTDVIDVVRVVFVAFLGQSPVDYFVNRCVIP